MTTQPAKRKRRSYKPEFKAEVVHLVNAGHKSAAQIAREFKLAESTVRSWTTQLRKKRDALVSSLWNRPPGSIPPTLSGVDLSQADFEGMDFGGVVARCTDFSRAILSDADLQRADLVGATFLYAQLDGADLTRANLYGANLTGTNLCAATLCDVGLTGASLEDSMCNNADFRGATLIRADLRGVVLRSANLTNANFAGAWLDEADLKDANFSNAHMTASTLLRADLRTACLSGAKLREVVLVGANLSSADFSGADLSGADLTGANLTRAAFDGAILSGADLTGAKLTKAAFEGADLSGTRLCSVQLCPGLLTAKSLSNATVDWRTVALSIHFDGLPEILRRSGMPDVVAVYLIDAVRSIDENDLFTMLQSVFLCYGSPDQPFAERLRNELTANGVKTWFFHKDAEFGARIHGHIQAQIHSYDRMILCCSEASLRRDGVLHEIEEVLGRERDEGGSEIMIPVILCELFKSGRTPPSWWPPNKEHIYTAIRHRVAADFRGAMEDNSKWREQLGRLLKALRKRPKAKERKANPAGSVARCDG